MTWNVRSFNTETTQLGEEIKRQQPHIVLLQETMMWIVNDIHLNPSWSGATILNMEAIKQTKGRRGGLDVIIGPDVEFTELYRTTIVADFEALKGPPLASENVELVNLFNSEEELSEGENDISQKLEEEALDINNAAKETGPKQPGKFLKKRPREAGSPTEKKPNDHEAK